MLHFEDENVAADSTSATENPLRSAMQSHHTHAFIHQLLSHNIMQVYVSVCTYDNDVGVRCMSCDR